MRKLNYIVKIYLLVVSVMLVQSCKKEGLEHFSSEKNTSSALSVKGLSGSIKKDAENVRIPIEIQLSAGASQAFEAFLTLDEEAVNKAILDGTLPNTLALPVISIEAPNAVTVPYGATKVIFEAVVSLPALEKFYFSGKKTAFAVKLTDASKGNQINTKNSIAIISLDPKEIISEQEMHYISILSSDGRIDVTGTSNYTPSVASIGIPMVVALSGASSRSFSVEVVVNNDTVSVLKANGILPMNTVVMESGEYELPNKVNVEQSSNSQGMDLIVPSQTLLKYRNNKIALVVQLTNTSRHVLHPVSRTVIVLIDPASIIAENNYIAQLKPFINQWMAALKPTDIIDLTGLKV